MGDKPLPGIAVEDIGRAAFAIFAAGDRYIGQTVGIAGEHLTGHQMAAAFTEALGTPVRYHDIPADVYRTFPLPGADDLGNMFQCFRDFNEAFAAARPQSSSRALVPALQTFREWLSSNASRLPMG